MKKKINRYMVLAVCLTLLSTILMTVGVFHHMYRGQVLDDLKNYAEVICGMTASGQELSEHYMSTDPDVRVTVISAKGEVLYDSQTGNEVLGNHADRPEVQEAEVGGSGYAIRHSDTIDRDMYYYAMMLEDGDVLRISKEADNIWSVFQKTLYGILGVGILMFFICMMLSRYLTNSIIRPIEKLAGDIDNLDGADTYIELVPFITTIQKQHEDILKGAKMRQEFTANVSHELKTPLTSISGYAELIETGLAGENEVQRFASEIHRNAKRLLTLINDIIRLSELDADNMEVSFAPLNLYELAKGCVQSLKLNAAKHDIEISCQGSDCSVNGNKDMLEELLYNLCDNAIRYNKPGGSVRVNIGMHGEHVLLTVKDTGIGIPKESQGRVFERFYRVDKSRSKQTGGTGLGLAIVKHIVAQHHARLDLKSQVGVGTEVSVLF